MVVSNYWERGKTLKYNSVVQLDFAFSKCMSPTKKMRKTWIKEKCNDMSNKQKKKEKPQKNQEEEKK